MTKLAAFLTKTVKRNDCWEWTSAYTGKAPFCYGLFHYKGTKEKASRYAYKEFVGPIPKDKPLVCHKCDNPICVNPDHLFAGSHRDNAMDCVKKGRLNKRSVEIGLAKEWKRQRDKKKCKRGHNISGNGSRMATNGAGRKYRVCRRCSSILAKARYEKDPEKHRAWWRAGYYRKARAREKYAKQALSRVEEILGSNSKAV